MTRKREVFLPRSKAQATKRPYIPSCAYLDVRIDPEQIQAIRAHNPAVKKTFLPVDKTEEEIDRLHEYNKMMGRV